MSRGKGGRGRGRGHGRGRGNASKKSGSSSTKLKGLCAELGENVFHYGTRKCQDLLKTTKEKCATYIGSHYSQDIATEILNETRFVVPTVEIPQDVIDRHNAEIENKKIQWATERSGHAQSINQWKQLPEKDRDYVKIGESEAKIHELTFKIDKEHPIELRNEDKSRFDSRMSQYSTREANLQKHRGQVYHLLLGQCTPTLQDKMKTKGTEWDKVKASTDPLMLLQLITSTVLSHNDDTNIFETIYEQGQKVKCFSQNQLDDLAYYDAFNQRVEVAEDIGESFLNDTLARHVSHQLFEAKQDPITKEVDWDQLTDDEQCDCYAEAREQYLTYMMLRGAASKHQKLKDDTRNDFIKNSGDYPKTRSALLKLFENYGKNEQPKVVEESAFTTKAKEVICHKCKKPGHYARNCPENDDDDKKKKAKDDDSSDDSSVESKKSRSSRSSKSSRKSKKKKEKKLTVKLPKKLSKEKAKQLATFAQTLSQIPEEDQDDSSLSDSDESYSVQFLTLEEDTCFLLGSKELDEAATIKHHHALAQKAKGAGLQLRDVVLLDNQSTCDIWCDESQVEKIRTSSTKMRIASNGGSLLVNQKAKVPGYRQAVWFSKNALTNILSLKNLIKQYRVTYDSEKATEFVVHRENVGMPDMHFVMHESGLHIYNPRQSHHQSFAITTLAQKKEGFS